MTKTHQDQPLREVMPVAAALQTLADARGPADVVVTNQASARLWPTISNHPLDFNYNPSTMGGAIPLALGLALAEPRREVIVVSGEGSLLMSLGSLVTVVASGATNLTVIVLDNGMYEVTGGQATPAAGQRVDFASLAKSAGFATAVNCSQLAQWQTRAAQLATFPGPRLFCLQVGPTDSAILAARASPIQPRLAQLRSALQNRDR